MSRFNLSRNEMIFMIIALIYVVSPIDFIPELITGPIGLTDDLAASTLIAATLWRAFRRQEDDGPGRGGPDDADAGGVAPRSTGPDPLDPGQ